MHARLHIYVRNYVRQNAESQFGRDITRRIALPFKKVPHRLTTVR
jgi:hypothetical protein